MNHAIALLLAVCLLAAAPARAGVIDENEPLVMRLIFDDCLGYIRDGKTPFQGLAIRPASAEAIGQMGRLPNGNEAVELISPRYAAVWGADKETRWCVVQTMWNADRIGGRGLLGVRAKGFVARVTERAVAAGIKERSPKEDVEFSPLQLISWHQPETGHEVGPQRPISFSVMPADVTEDDIADAGQIVMGGPPLK